MHKIQSLNKELCSRIRVSWIRYVRSVKGMSARENKVNFHRRKSSTVSVRAKQSYTGTKDKMDPLGALWRVDSCCSCSHRFLHESSALPHHPPIFAEGVWELNWELAQKSQSTLNTED